MELSKVTMILRGYTYEQVRCVAEVLINSSYVRKHGDYFKYQQCI